MACAARDTRRPRRDDDPVDGPVRTCVACRARRSRDDLLRLVADEDGRVRLDYRGRAPGRGVHVCASGKCLAAACLGGRLAAALHRPVEVPDAQVLVAAVVDRATERVASLLSSARGAGFLVIGVDNVVHRASDGRRAVTIVAHDLAPNSRERLVRSVGAAALTSLPGVDQTRLGSWIGASQVGVVRVADTGFVRAIGREIARLLELHPEGLGPSA
jgi:uncharacterized protein